MSGFPFCGRGIDGTDLARAGPVEPSCLNGSLGDLSIQDVLQVLFLGRKTGSLEVETPAGAGAIVFERGRVVASVLPDDDSALKGGAAPPAGGPDGRIRERITTRICRLARCREGEFTFVPSTDSRLVLRGRDIASESLPSGIDVIELLIEVACRLEDEDRGAPHAPEARPSVLLVDYEERVRRLLSYYLVEGGYRVVEAGDVESAVKTGESLAAAGVRFVLVTDINMPGASRDSFRGGVEVMRRLAGLRLRPPVVMMADSESWSLSARTMRIVSSVVIKPRPSRLDSEELEAGIRALAGRMVQDVLPRVCAAALA